MTPTSVLPPCDTRAASDRGCGFTLIEILVVLTIVGVIASVVVARLNLSDFGKAQQEAENVSLVLEAASEQAIFSGHSIGISSDGQGFQLWTSAGQSGEWTQLPADGVLAARQLTSGVAWKAQRVNEQIRPLGERIVFAPDGVVEPVSIEIGAGEAVVAVEMDALGRIEVRDAAQR